METGIKEKLPNPRKDANIISVALFGYTFRTFFQGFRKEIEEKDLTDVLNQHRSHNLGDKLETAWEKEKAYCDKPSLWRVLRKVFGWQLLLPGVIVLFSECGLKLAQPLVLWKLIAYYTQTGNVERNINDGYLYSGLLVLVTFLNVSVVHHNMLHIQILAMKARIACCSLIYRKSLRLSRAALLNTAAGQLTNLLSNDVSRFDTGIIMFNTIWVCPIQLILTACILYALLGFTATIGILFLVLCMPLQVYLGKLSSKFRLKTALKTDQRVRLMAEILSGIQVIKMYTWEKPFSSVVDAVRRIEVGHIRTTSYIKGILTSFLHFPKIAVFLSILTYVLTGSIPNAEYVFVALAFHNTLRQSASFVFPRVLSAMAELRVSINRLQKFLLLDEIDQKSQIRPDIITYPEPQSKVIGLVELKNASAAWVDVSEKTLVDINLKVSENQLVAIIGPVGCGKTSILQTILKELPLSNGAITVVGKISYASQEPWLFGSSIKQNILFGQKMNFQRYSEVIKVCALEQDLALLPYGDLSLVGDRGVSLSGGQKARISLARAVYADADIYLLDDPLSAVDPHVARELFDKCITKFLRNKCRILVTHQTQFLQNTDKIYLVEGGKILASGTYTEIKESTVYFAKYLQTSEVADTTKLVVKMIQNETKVKSLPQQAEEQKCSGSVSGSVYKTYFEAGGAKMLTVTVFLLFIVTATVSAASEYFLSYWVNQEQMRVSNTNTSNSTLLSTSTCIYIYTAMVAFLLLLMYSSGFIFFSFCMRASIVLHNNMFVNIVRAPLRFFNINPSGRILNRFSKDIGSVDEALPSIAVECIHVILTTGSAIILICIVNPWLLIVTSIILFIFFLIVRIYLSTSRSIKRLEGITRSPVFTHINASIQGLTTIRAFKVQNLLQDEFDQHQDLHTSAWYLFLITSRSFGFYLDLFSIIYITIVTFSFFIIPTEFGGNVGLSITQALSLTGIIQWGTRQWSELQNYMTSVERVVEYTKIEPENKRKEQKLALTWPEKGKIVFESLSLQYAPSDPYVLKQLSFRIEPQEKIGVVGRTGAGKSSLIMALFQLVNTEGSIFIDDVNITQIPFNCFRNKISIIPQEPVLFSGTLRKNLDPFNLHTDFQLWKALEDVELKSLVLELPLALMGNVSEGGTNFSVGQRQLLCLARAIIRNNNILILDEATANVDPQTDTVIQETIRNKFSNCTVLTIAHRLNTIIDSDKILVLDAGRVVEFDHPHTLLQNKMGMFYSMVQQTGEGSAELLIQIAAKSFNKKKTE